MKKIIKFIEENKVYATTILRIGLGLVLLWFGIDQLIHSDNWFRYIPSWLTSLLPFSLNVFITINGAIEIIMGISLLIGFYTRIVAVIVSLHLLSITFSIGYNDVAVRDFGLSIMAISLIFSGAGNLSFDNKKKLNN